MTTNFDSSEQDPAPSRLDRIERILGDVAQRQESLTQRQESLTQQQESLTQQLQETRAIADSNARALQETRAIVDSNARALQETRAIADSNARSIQAWEARIEENRVEAEEERSQLRVATLNLQAAVNELIQANRQNAIEHELFRRRFEAIDPLLDAE
jgi:chromosome segregation ATPase